MDLQAMLPVARRAASAAGEVLMRHWNAGVEIRNKSVQGGATYDLVSDADIEAEKTIEAHLGSEFPTHDLLGEESLDGSPNAEHLWVIDPLDGTNNFAHRVPHFAVSIAYWQSGVPKLAVIHNPAREDWYYAIHGGGAFHNNQRVSVSQSKTLDEVLIGCGFYYDRGQMMRDTLEVIASLFEKHIHGIRRFGTASLDLCQVGTGQFGGFFEYQLSPWDFAAGALFVEEAGGQVTTAAGNRLTLQKTSLLASNRHLHNSLLQLTGRFDHDPS